MASLVALGVQNPQIDTMGSFAQGAQARQTFDDNQITLARKGLENIGSIALGAMGGKLDGQVNPEQFEQGLDLLEQNGLDVSSFRGRPEVAPIAARASMSALDQLKTAQSEQDFKLAMDKFQLEMQKAAKGPDPTDDQREYDMAVSQGYKGSFMDYMQEIKKAGATNINMGPNGIDYGDPGAGYVWQRDPATNEIVVDERGAPIAIPYKGGKPYMEQEAAAAAAANKDASAGVKADIVTQDVTRALEKIKADPFWTTGFFGKWAAELGGNEATNVKRLIETVKANAGFKELQTMRESSPTGAALGNVTEKELAFLQATIGSLEQDQTAEQLQTNLERVKEAYLDIIHGPGNRPAEAGSPGGGAAQPGSPGGDGVVDWTDLDWGN